VISMDYFSQKDNRRPTIVADVRCLQDPSYARRGVGRHTLALLQGAPQQIELIALCDPALPPLIHEASVLFPKVALNAAAVPPLHCFVELSPMTHDPLFVAKLLQAHGCLRAAVVYDFIPLRRPEFYLANRVPRLEYRLCLHWLSRYDLFLPISQAAAVDLKETLRIERNRIHVTGAPVAPVFASLDNTARKRSPRHLLVVAGPDPRKNPELAIRAHALSRRLQQERVPLVISGNYSLEILGHFRSIAADLRGDPELIEIRASVSDAILVDIYARAYGVIAPSRDEGFSLPVVEGMAAGVPCIASDIPAHRELLPEDDDRFDCDDVSRLSSMLERMVFDVRWRETAAERQAPVWPKFRSDEVARRFWAPITERLSQSPGLPRPALARGRRPRVALLTPLPPDRSGVADYTAATCEELGKLVELDVFTETRSPSPLPRASVRPLDATPHLDSNYDRVISVIGNSHFHERIFELLRRHGGASIAHDARMLGFYRIRLGEQRALEVASKELGRPVDSDELKSWLADEGLLKATFLGEVLESSSPMIVHSPVTAAQLGARYGTPPPCLPFSIYRSWSEAELSPARRRAARWRLGLADANMVIVSFGAVHATKAPKDCIWALETLLSWGIPATLHFVGDIHAMYDKGADLRALAARLGLSRHVRFLDEYVTEEIYKDYLLAADVAVQLRTYGLGALSGAVLDCAAVGLPCVINVALADACDVPTTLARRVPNQLSPLLIAEKVAELHDEGVGANRPESARRAFCEARSAAKYSLELCNVIGLEVSSARLAVT